MSNIKNKWSIGTYAVAIKGQFGTFNEGDGNDLENPLRRDYIYTIKDDYTSDRVTLLDSRYWVYKENLEWFATLKEAVAFINNTHNFPIGKFKGNGDCNALFSDGSHVRLSSVDGCQDGNYEKHYRKAYPEEIPTMDYKVGDWVLTSKGADGWGSGKTVCNKILQIKDITEDIRTININSGGYYVYFNGDEKLTTAISQIVRKADPEEIPKGISVSIAPTTGNKTKLDIKNGDVYIPEIIDVSSGTNFTLDTKIPVLCVNIPHNREDKRVQVINIELPQIKL